MLALSLSSRRISPTFFATLAGLAVAAAWDASALDLPLAQLAGGPSGFALREHWLLAGWLHDGGRRLAWLLAGGLFAGVWFPWGPLRRLQKWQRMRLACATLIAALVVSLLKGLSPASCPWDLDAFGGAARYVSHWSFRGDGGAGGHCFPAGHASTGFSFMSGFFSFREVDPVLARRWLGLALVAGLLFAGAQQLRGAHFMSHGLWTAWICWVAAWTVHGFWRQPEAAR